VTVYIVETTDGTTRVVRTNHKAKAVRHVARAYITSVKAASGDDVADAVQAGRTIEDTQAEDDQDPMIGGAESSKEPTF
jgi:hypothetical protein